MKDCIFCKIANQEISTEIVYENDNVIAFKSIDPKACIHLIITTKKHYDTILDIDDAETIQDLHKAIKEVSQKFNIYNSGFRLINNCKEDSGQEVMHVHIHMLGRERLRDAII